MTKKMYYIYISLNKVLTMKKLLLLLLMSCASTIQAHTIGLLVVATGKYIEFVPPLIKSARQHFCTDHNVTYFVFTDGVVPDMPNVVIIPQSRLGWPYDTMMRFAMYYNNKHLFANIDYLFACDSDMLFCDTVGDEILGDRVATQHPGYVGHRGTYETRPISTACVARHEGKQYFAGGFYGGTTTEFLNMMSCVTTNIQKDLDRQFVAVWHDESHLNRYFIDHEPTVILSPSYCYPGNLVKDYPKKLWALVKDHASYQTRI